ncbi:hypothetical protein [uncultured Paraglaciecola sp.]|uniref:hypothetical protein n=1 Tax=uncultured Paraglaciecola sp. TaxID=1765024 RepID=UPI0030D7E7D5|tara:strand:- start:30329 stop:31123 length:795 start_codon:yes stop_codon:yes gene_type:complete
MTKTINWWGEVSLALDEVKVWGLGKRMIAIQRLPKEWVIWNKESDSESTSQITVKSLKTANTFSDPPYSRHLVNQTTDTINISPMLADRPIVARPATSLNILPGEHIELYISSPLWFLMKLKNKTSPIVDIPFLRPSDSWFGPSTMEGELCYAKYTDARVNLLQIEKRGHRAITPVLIKNQHTETLVIERINLPAPFLALYADENQDFWTQEVEITYHSDSDKTGLRLKRSPPDKGTGNMTLVSDARQISDNRHFVKSIKSLLG